MCPDEGRLHVRERAGSWGLVQEMGWKAVISELGETRVGAVGWNVGLLLRSLYQEGPSGRGFCPRPWGGVGIWMCAWEMPQPSLLRCGGPHRPQAARCTSSSLVCVPIWRVEAGLAGPLRPRKF